MWLNESPLRVDWLEGGAPYVGGGPMMSQPSGALYVD